MAYETNKYGVFFIDILGMGALTNAQFDVSSVPAHLYGAPRDSEKFHYYIAASLLKQFRDIVCELASEYSNVKFLQYSDCAFLYSMDLVELFFAASEFMRKSLFKGVLCRGGLAYDDLITENQADYTSLSEFIVGPAATKAVKVESLGKGCRIFTEVDFASAITKHFTNTSFINKVVNYFKIPTDYSVIDEVKWYLLPRQKKYFDTITFFPDAHKDICKAILGYINYLRFSPMFKVNSLNKDGRIHLSASIEALSSSLDFVLKENDFKSEACAVHEAYECEDYPPNNSRNQEQCDRVLKLQQDEIDQQTEDYFLWF